VRAREATLRVPPPGDAASPAPRCVGRPRSEAVRQRILVAARELLEERGLHALTIEAIADRAGAGKVTVYRWWTHKAAIVLEAMLAETSPRMPYRECQSPLESLKDQMRSFVRFLNGKFGRLLALVIAEAVLDDEVGKAYREHWVRPRRDDARKLLRQAIEVGELPEDSDLEVVLDALFAPLYHRFLTRYAPLTPAYAESVFRAVTSGVASPRARARLQGKRHA
jgi:AcrR family transcriptional regulator